MKNSQTNKTPLYQYYYYQQATFLSVPVLSQ